MDIKSEQVNSPDDLRYEANAIVAWYNKEVKPVSKKINNCGTLINKTIPKSERNFNCPQGPR